MNNYLDLLKTPTTDPVQQKRQQLEAVSAEKKSNLAGLDFYSIAAGVARGTGEASASTDELAMRNLSPAELRYRYGDEVGAYLTQQRGAGDFEYGRDRYATRTRAEALQDTALGVGTGFANALAGIGALGAGLVSPTAGAAVSDWIQQGNEWASGFQSDALQRRSRANQAGTQLAYRDNALRQQQENDGDFVGSLKRIGRDAVSAVSGALDDGTIAGQGTAEGIGSLLAFGPISKGLRTIGSATMNLAGRTGVANVQGARVIAGAGATNAETMALGRAMADAANPSMIGAQGTARLMRGSDALRGPAAIAAMESGGTYSGTISEIMEMSHEDLLANSPVYRELLKTMDPEDAKIELATNAGLRAAAFVAPVAAATGALVSRFEAAPFRAPSIRQGLGNVLVREPTEEGIQSLAGSLASGEAIQTYADSTRDIAEGAGEELGLGALYGMTAAGTVQTPTLGGRTVYHGMRGIGKAAKDTGRFVINRFEEVESKTSKDSPISSQKVGEAVQAVSQEIGAVTETLNSAIEQGEGTPEQKQVERDFVANINRAIQIAPEELDKLPQSVQEEIGNTNRRDLAVASIAARIPDLGEGSVEYMQAVTSLQELLEPVKSLQMADLRNLENTSNEQAQKVLNSIKWMLTQIDNTPEVRKAQEHISNITTPEKIQETIDRFGSDEAIRTPEGQVAAKAVAAAMTMNPGTGTRQAAEILLRHSNSGALQLTNPQERAVRATLSLLVQHENFLTQQKALGLNRAQDVVSRQIISNTDDMSKTERGKLSLRQYTDRILTAMNSNNTEEATGWMEDLGMFVQHMNNKVNAVNQHYAEGNAKGITNLPKVKYQALNPDHTVEDPWYESPDGVHVSATNPNSVRLVQSMHLEGQTLADVYNGLVEALPELGLSPIEFNGLDPALLESAEQVASFAREAQRAARRPQTQTQSAKAQKAAPAKQEATPTPKAKPVEATPVSRITQEQAQALSDEGLNKRIEAIQEKRSKKTNTPEDDATFKVLDEEMSRREDAAAREIEAEESEAQAAETARILDVGGAKNVKELFEYMRGVAPARLQPIYAALEKVLDFEKLKLVREDASPTQNWAAAWEDATKTLRIYTNTLANVDGFLDMPFVEAWSTAIAHELVHAATTAAISRDITVFIGPYDQRDLDGRLTDISDRLREYVRNNRSDLSDIERHVAQQMLRNNQELVAWGMTDSSAQQLLEKIPGKGKTTLFGNFVTAIKTLLGLGENNSALNDLLRVGAELLSADTDTTTKGGLTLEERRARNAERNKRVKEQREQAQKQKQEKAPQEKPKLTLEERRARNKERNERVRKQREEAKQQQREEELETPVVEKATTPEPREEVDPSTLVPENDDTPERRGMVARFYDSIWKPLTNKLMDSFRLRPDIKDQPASRIAGHESPIAWVREALSSEENFREVLGKDPVLALDEDIVDAYSVLLDNSGKIKMSVGNIKKIMERNLKEFLSRDAVKKAIANDQEANRWANGKALNITRPVLNAKGEEVGLEYNQELLEAAILAGVQWVLNGDQISRDLDADDFLRITGVEAHMISEAKKEAIASGLPAEQVKIPIARLITQFWGLQPRKNADRAYSEGIPEAVAAEVVRALEETDFMDMLPTTIGPEEGLDKPKTLTTHRVNYDKINPQLGNYADAIQDVVLTEVQPSRFIGEDTIPPVAKRQMNNPDVENTPAQQRAIKAANAIKYRVNLPMMHFLGAFGPEEMINLTGEVDPDWTVQNINHIETLKGKALSYENSFKEVFSTIEEMRNRGQRAGIGLKNQVIRYAHNMSKVGRLQQLGRYNPQSSKLTREVILPTWSTLDLTNNADHQRAFHLALAQHLGIKIHKMPYEQAKREVLKKLKSEEAKPLMRAMRKWLQNTDINSETLTDNQMDGRDWHRLMKQAGFPPTFGAYHAVMEYARFMRARGRGRTEFETSLYLEADGVTNGPIMAMLMLSIGNFIGKGTRGFDWIGTVEKGGISFGSKKAMFSLDQVDLYQTAAANMVEPYKQLRAEFQQSGDEVVKVSDSLAIVMDALFDGDVRYNPDDNSVEIKRGITKNPLTITVYGSSPNGIAGSFVNRVVDEMYALQTKMASNVDNGMDPWTGLFENKEAMERFQQAMRDITNSKILWNSKQKKYFRTSVTNTRHKDRTSFTFTMDELNNMRNNFLVGFVEPMVEGITKTVGPGVMQASDLIRRSTQIQSIYMEDAYRKAVNERLENRKKNDPSFKAGDFLSREDFEAIDAEISKKFPNVKTKTQTFRVTKRADVIGEKHPTYSRDFNDKMQTSPDVIAPGNSGVSGIAYLNIGFGDGNMIQVAIQNPALDRVLAVFDGINMPLDRINEISEIANKAVFEAGMGNPLQAVKEAFDTFLESVGPETELTERGWKDLARAVYGSSDADIEILKAEIGDIMAATKEQLDFAARSVHARHRALRDVGMSIDHMAGASTPFYQGPTHDLTKEQLAELLQSRYEKYMAEDGKVVEPKYFLKDRGELDDNGGTGVKLFRWDAFKYLAKELNLSQGQSQVMEQVLSALGATDFKIVAGTRQEILSYRVSRGMDPGVFGENDNGLISMADRTIYLINPTGETFTHELVHAATMNILLAHYQGQDLGSNKVIIEGAVNRLEQMAEAFLLEDIDPALPAEVQQAMADAKAAMDNFLSEGMDPAVAQAGMLGEFIAWTLTNNALMKELKQKPVNKFVKWARDVMEAIKELIWGKKKMPQPAEDVYSNILFNTGILMQAQKDVSATFQEMTQKHTSNNPRLENLRNTFRQLVLDSIKQAPPLEQKAAKWDKTQAITATQEVARKAAYAFGLSHLEESTLVSIASALTTVKDLDPQVMMGMQNMYQAVQDQLKVEDFNRDGQEDPWANEKYNIIMGRRDRFYNQDDVSNLLPVFVGLSMVSEDFRRVLANKTLPKTQSDHSSFDNWVGSLGYRGMEAINNALTRQGNNRTVQGALDSMMDRLIQTVQDETTMMETVEKNTDRVLSLNDHLRDALQHASRKVYEFGAHVENTSNNKVVQGAGRVVSVVSSIVNEEKADIVADSVLVTGNRLKLGNAMMHLIKDFMGRTEATGGVYDLIKPIRAMVQQIRQQFRDNVPEIILKQFTNEPTEEQLTAMYQGMGRADLAALVASGMSRSDVLNLLTDPRERRRLTRDLENQLRQLDPKHYNKLQDKMKQLANYMNGKGTGQILLRNAYAVANLWGVPNTSNRKAPSEDMIKLVDQLVSLYAFEDLSADVKTTLKTLVEDEAKGMDFVLAYLEGQRKTEVARSRLGRARANHYKGYIPSLPQKQGHLIVAEDKDFTNLKLSGYTRVGSYNGPSLGSTRVSMGYYYSSTPSRAAFAQGMMQNIVQSASGVERSTGFTMGHTAGRITNRRMVRKLIQRMHADKGLTENLMPVFNDKGVIVAFERSIDPKYLQLLEPSQQIHSMLGVWRGRQIEEKLATEVNKTLLDKLYENWQQGQKDNLGDTYVNLLDPSVLDRVQQDAVDLFSDETLKYAQQLFGKGNLMVRADLLDDVTGYRNPTVGDFWTNNNRLSKETNETIKRMLIGFFGQDAYQKLVKAEQVVQGLVSDARTLIVVKSMVVPAINIISNVYQLVSRRVNPIQMARDFPKKLNEINTYVRTKLEQVELEARIRAAGDDTRLKTKLHARIRSITDAHKRLSIWPLIQAGEFSTIADVGMSREDMKLSSGRVGEWLDAQVKKMPEGLQAAAKYGLVTKDTALFQGLQKSVQYGDFIAKAILYDHLTKKEKLTREQALARITEEFVNYDRLPGRVRSGLENMGMLWFYNFKLRSTKVGLSILRNNPLHALLVMGLPMPYGIGTPVDENVITKGLEGTLGYTLGPGMGLRAPSLNPWINVISN